jgi:hypothetical protein
MDSSFSRLRHSYDATALNGADLIVGGLAALDVTNLQRVMSH